MDFEELEKSLEEAQKRTLAALEAFFTPLMRTTTFTNLKEWRIDEGTKESNSENNENNENIQACSPEKEIFWIKSSWDVGGEALLSTMVEQLHQPAKIPMSRRHVVSCYTDKRERLHYVHDHDLDDHDPEGMYPSAASHVLQALIHGLLLSQPNLQKIIEPWYAESFRVETGSSRFYKAHTPTNFTVLSILFYNLVSSDMFEPTYLVVGGSGVNTLGNILNRQLLRLIVKSVKLSSRIRWVVSVDLRNWENVESALSTAAPSIQAHQTLDLDGFFDEDRFSDFVRAHAVERVTDWKMNSSYKEKIHIRDRLLDTVKTITIPDCLWIDVALRYIAQNNVLPWEVDEALHHMAINQPTLTELYTLALSYVAPLFDNTGDIDPSPKNTSAYCRNVLAVMATVLRPLPMSELSFYSRLPPICDIELLLQTQLSIFLEVSISDNNCHMVTFTHYLARDYVLDRLGYRPGTDSTLSSRHMNLARSSLELLKSNLPSRGNNNGNNYSHSNDRSDGSSDGNIDNKLDYSIYMWLAHLVQTDNHYHVEVYTHAIHIMTFYLYEWFALFHHDKGCLLECSILLRRLYSKLQIEQASKIEEVSKIEPVLESETTLETEPLFGPEPPSEIAPSEAAPTEMEPTEPVPDEASSRPLPAHRAIQLIQEVLLIVELSKTELENDLRKALRKLIIFSPSLPLLREILLPQRKRRFNTPSLLRGRPRKSLLHSLPHEDPVNNCSFSPGGQILASASKGGLIRVWDMRTGVLLRKITAFSDSALGVFIIPRIVDDNDNKDVKIGPRMVGPGEFSLIACSSSGIKAWDLETGLQQIYLAMTINKVAMSPHSDKIAVAGSTGLYVWKTLQRDIQDHAKNMSQKSFYGDKTDLVHHLEFSPDGNILASSDGKRIQLWNESDGCLHMVELYELPPSDKRFLSEYLDGYLGLPKLGAATITCIAFSPDGNYIVSGNNNSHAHLWDIDHRHKVAAFRCHTWIVDSVAFSPDGTSIATGCRDGSVSLWKKKWPGVDGCQDAHTAAFSWDRSPDRIISLASLHYPVTVTFSKTSGAPVRWLAFAHGSRGVQIVDIDAEGIGYKNEDTFVSGVYADQYFPSPFSATPGYWRLIRQNPSGEEAFTDLGVFFPGYS